MQQFSNIPLGNDDYLANNDQCFPKKIFGGDKNGKGTIRTKITFSNERFR